MIIAVTGYIGTGKTSAAQVFEKNGFTLVNADNASHALLRDKSIKDRIVSAFGMDILGRDLEIDREKLGEIVFNDEVKLKLLDSVVHPELEREMKKIIKKIGGDIVLDVALFKELHLEEVTDKTLLVKAELSNVYERLRSRYSQRQILNIMNSQNILVGADFTVKNNTTLDELREKILCVIQELKQ